MSTTPPADKPPGLPRPQPVEEAEAEAPRGVLPEAIAEAQAPVVLRGLVAHWPVVAAAREGAPALAAYLRRFDVGARVTVTVGDSSLRGRIFYDEAMRGGNAARGQTTMGEVIARVTRHGRDADPPLIYLASTDAEACLPGFRSENDVGIGPHEPIVSVWYGTRTRIAAHNDLPRNLACVAAGRRRFTLFPPSQTPNLYPGPIEHTPAGRPVSMVDFAEPDLVRFPRFAEAMATAQVAELESGDALFVPSMWWHHVEAPTGVNLLVNYWWRTVGAHLGTPQDALNHAVLSVRDLPPEEKAVWRAAFDHYVFGDADLPRAHLPEHAQGMLGPMTPERARRLRADLLNKLNR